MTSHPILGMDSLDTWVPGAEMGMLQMPVVSSPSISFMISGAPAGYGNMLFTRFEESHVARIYLDNADRCHDFPLLTFESRQGTPSNLSEYAALPV